MPPDTNRLAQDCGVTQAVEQERHALLQFRSHPLVACENFRLSELSEPETEWLQCILAVPNPASNVPTHDCAVEVHLQLVELYSVDFSAADMTNRESDSSLVHDAAKLVSLIAVRTVRLLLVSAAEVV